MYSMWKRNFQHDLKYFRFRPSTMPLKIAFFLKTDHLETRQDKPEVIQFFDERNDSRRLPC